MEQHRKVHQLYSITIMQQLAVCWGNTLRLHCYHQACFQICKVKVQHLKVPEQKNANNADQLKVGFFTPMLIACDLDLLLLCLAAMLSACQ